VKSFFNLYTILSLALVFANITVDLPNLTVIIKKKGLHRVKLFNKFDENDQRNKINQTHVSQRFDQNQNNVTLIHKPLYKFDQAFGINLSNFDSQKGYFRLTRQMIQIAGVYHSDVLKAYYMLDRYYTINT
jgi:hypothetical protein